jgi:multiple sugar transport system ATP-binding protein
MADVRIEGLSKQFAEVAAVKGVSLHVRDHEFLTLLGPSGCGKTTTMRCIVGLERPDAGEIYIGDQRVTSLPPRQRDVALVFQNYALYPHMTVRDNIGYPLKLRRVAGAQRQAAIQETAELFSIGHLLDRYPRQLSGGEQQRVALSRAVVRHPKVFLMDEPLSNIDALLRVLMRAELKRLQQRLGITTIFVTHDQVEAMTLSDRIVVMELGEVRQVGSPLDIYHRPATLFVARFVGSPPMNFFTGTLERTNGSWTFASPDVRLSLPASVAQAGGDVTLGARPEEITLSTTELPDAPVGEVLVVEPLGHETIVHVTVGREIVRVRVSGDSAWQPGQRVWLRIARTLVFETAGGRLLS